MTFQALQILKGLLFRGLFCLIYLISPPAFANTIFMDSELYDWSKSLTEPLLDATELSSQDVRVYIVKDPEINAYVLANGTIVINSGLILKADNQYEVQGVIAHELGHLIGKHHLRRHAQSQDSALPAVVGALLGIGAAAAGAPDATAALIIGGQSLSTSHMLRHSRTHEWEADRIAVDILQKKELPITGLASFFEKLRDNQLLYSRQIPHYLQTHPHSKSRLEALRQHIKEDAPPLSADEAFIRIQTKLKAYNTPLITMLRQYPQHSSSKITHYARAYAYALAGKTQKALQELNFIKSIKTDSYLQELKALLYVDLGQTETAHHHFKEAIRLNRSNAPLLINAADNAIVAGYLDTAIRYLKHILILEPSWYNTRQSLGIAYGKKGEELEGRLYLAEEALLQNNKKDVALHLQFISNMIQSGNSSQKERHRQIELSLETLE